MGSWEVGKLGSWRKFSRSRRQEFLQGLCSNLSLPHSLSFFFNFGSIWIRTKNFPFKRGTLSQSSSASLPSISHNIFFLKVIVTFYLLRKRSAKIMKNEVFMYFYFFGGYFHWQLKSFHFPFSLFPFPFPIPSIPSIFLLSFTRVRWFEHLLSILEINILTFNTTLFND